MAFKGIYIKLPQEAIDLLDVLAEHLGEVPPARQGRTSVILWLLRHTSAGDSVSDIRKARRALDKVMNPSTTRKNSTTS